MLKEQISRNANYGIWFASRRDVLRMEKSRCFHYVYRILKFLHSEKYI